MTRNNYLFIILFFIVFVFLGSILIFAQTTSTFIFNTNLKLGDSSLDVMMLQKILNHDARTAVAFSGVGSVGNETQYFGLHTQQAVIKFQELYASDVLYSYDLIHGTGYVGGATRKKLNALLYKTTNTAKAIVPISNTVSYPSLTIHTENRLTTNVPSISTTGSVLLVSSISKYFGPVGTEVTIVGSGFTPQDNKINLGAYSIPTQYNSSNSSLNFTIPSAIPWGQYSLSVTNSSGTSIGDLFFVITDPNTNPPTVSSVSPASVFYGDAVAITGSGFTTTGNEIRSSYGDVNDISSADGKTLTFNILPFQNSPSIQTSIALGKKTTEYKVYLYVVNKNGVSANPAVITLKI